MRRKDLKGEVNLFKYLSHLKYLIEWKKNRFPYHGVYCFCGRQGSGKTISAVRMISNIYLDFKDVYLVTNVNINTDILKHIPKENIIRFERYYQLFFNYDKPTIFLIDEAHILFNSLESKNADVNMFQVISQNRKRQRVFVLTSQVFSRLQLVMREQINTIVKCDTYLHYLTHCVVYHEFEKKRDELVGKKSFGCFYTHNRNIHYEMYDTDQVIDFGKDSSFWTKEREDIENGFYDKYERFIEKSR
ncbi:MAG: ATP-binding protein [Bacilli bacterium]|jgi:hypothetical protein|nr:ATP-binding protein [Bacilli bacterium]